MAIQHDGQINIAVANSRRSTKWQNKEMLWSEFVARLAIVQRTQESQAEYTSWPKARREEAKDTGGYVGGVLRGGRRKATAIASRRLLTLDFDYVPEGADPWQVVVLVLGCAATLYSTHSHTKKDQRLRMVIPLSRDVTPDEYEAISRRVAADISIDMCDDTTYEAHRLMYWPSASYDAEYRYEVNDGPWLDPDEQLQRYTDWTDPTQWPTSSRKSEALKRVASKQGDPLTKTGMVGAFCRVYDIAGAIETFLPDVYTQCEGEDRYTFAGGTTSGGLVMYEEGKFAYSHHGTDPISGKLVNAFDLVRLHMFGEQDDEMPQGTPATKYPSYAAMCDLAGDDVAVHAELVLSNLREMAAAFDDDFSAEDNQWATKLKSGRGGAVEETIDNIFTILMKDPKLAGFHYDEFSRRAVVHGDLPWQVFATRVSVSWGDTDDAGLRQYLEVRYKIDHITKTKEALELAFNARKRHPIKEYLGDLVWDGVPRAETLLIEYLGAEDSVYTRAVTRKALIGAVARIYVAGCKHDQVLTLVGPQGGRKSTLFAKLGGAWFSDSLQSFVGKEAVEQLQGKWILELSELTALKKSEVEIIKQFISKQTDNIREAYARRTVTYPRQCAFFGSTNEPEFLRDPTGGRRFWPVSVTMKGNETIDRLTEAVVNQVWAEATVYFSAGEPWWLDGELEAIARLVQAEYTEGNNKKGMIENFLDRKLPADWAEKDIDARQMFWSGDFDGLSVGTVQRQSICALEIWVELFKGDAKACGQIQSRELNAILRDIDGWRPSTSYNCGRLYGRQRAFLRNQELLD